MSYNYSVTFRIADRTVGGKTYNDRHEAMIDGLKMKGKGWWAEPTSFILVESELSTPHVRHQRPWNSLA